MLTFIAFEVFKRPKGETVKRIDETDLTIISFGELRLFLSTFS